MSIGIGFRFSLSFVGFGVVFKVDCDCCPTVTLFLGPFHFYFCFNDVLFERAMQRDGGKHG